jgi:hypothetical protein
MQQFYTNLKDSYATDQIRYAGSLKELHVSNSGNQTVIAVENFFKPNWEGP